MRRGQGRKTKLLPSWWARRIERRCGNFWRRNFLCGKFLGNGALLSRLGTMSAERFRARSGGRSFLAARQRDLALRYGGVADFDGEGGLNKSGHAAGDARFNLEDFAGLCRSENFYSPNGGEF